MGSQCCKSHRLLWSQLLVPIHLRKKASDSSEPVYTLHFKRKWISRLLPCRWLQARHAKSTTGNHRLPAIIMLHRKLQWRWNLILDQDRLHVLATLKIETSIVDSKWCSMEQYLHSYSVFRSLQQFNHRRFAVNPSTTRTPKWQTGIWVRQQFTWPN